MRKKREIVYEQIKYNKIIIKHLNVSAPSVNKVFGTNMALLSKTRANNSKSR